MSTHRSKIQSKVVMEALISDKPHQNKANAETADLYRWDPSNNKVAVAVVIQVTATAWSPHLCSRVLQECPRRLVEEEGLQDKLPIQEQLSHRLISISILPFSKVLWYNRSFSISPRMKLNLLGLI
jgi:hypothetical protein